MSKSAVVVGPYRVHNFGDDLVGAILVKKLQQRGYTVVVPKLGLDNCEWLGIEYREDYDDSIKNADLVVVGGGGIMSDTSGANPGASYLDIVARAALRGETQGKRVIVTSVGAGPWILERSKMLAFGVSLLAEKVGVREQESLDHLEGIGIKGGKVVLGADCALLTPQYLEYEPRERRKIGFQYDIRGFDELAKSDHASQISAAAREYVRINSSRINLISNGKGRPQLAAEAPGTGVLRYSNLAEFLPRLAGHSALFTSHLHLAITAFSQRIPTFSFYVREKTRRFYEQIGRPERAIDISKATPEDFMRMMSEMESATWTDQDEETLVRLQSEAARLLDIVS